MKNWTILAAFAAVTIISGCGKPVDSEGGAPASTSGAPISAGSGTTTVKAVFTEWSITLTPAKAARGTVNFEVSNGGKTPHGFYITGPGVDGKGNLLQPGQSETLPKQLEPGEFQIIDFVGSNETAHGMTATLTVE